MNKALQDIDRVCRGIEEEWRQYDDDVNAFPDIVMRRTEGLDLTSFGDLGNIMELMADPYVAHLQKLTTFSDIYLILWHNGRFHVEVLNWWGSDINIHDHNFSGVQFQLAGTSLNILYDFEPGDRSSRLRSGPISVRSAEIWNPGDRSWVRPGARDPHTVHHLSIPTVSLLFRTIPTPDFGPQLNYFPPSIAASYTVADVNFRKKKAALELLSRGPRPDFHRVFRQVTASQTATENLFTIIKMTETLFERDHVGLLHEFAERGETERSIIEAAAYRKATEFLLENVKQLPDLRPNEVLAISILGAVFDEEGLRTVLSSLSRAGHNLDFKSSITSTYRRLPGIAQREFEKVVDLFELFDIRDAICPREKELSRC